MLDVELHVQRQLAERLADRIDRRDREPRRAAVVDDDVRAGVVERDGGAGVFARRYLRGAEHLAQAHELREVDLGRHRQRLNAAAIGMLKLQRYQGHLVGQEVSGRVGDRDDRRAAAVAAAGLRPRHAR